MKAIGYPLSVIGCVVFCTALLQAVGVNSPAPNFTLKNTAKVTRKLADYKGKVILINFWASWCAPCQAELPELNRLAAAYAGKKVQILPINVDTDYAAARQALGLLGLQHPAFEVLWDAHSKTVSTYNIESMPSSFIVDPHGVIRFMHTGFHSTDPAAWRKEIDSLLH